MGCFVWVNYVSRLDAAEETLELVRQAGGQGQAVQFDVAEFNQVQAGFKDVVAESGSLDI
jgi:3-oxoacyl-[acyl-carrier protein] reductase